MESEQMSESNSQITAELAETYAERRLPPEKRGITTVCFAPFVVGGDQVTISGPL